MIRLGDQLQAHRVLDLRSHSRDAVLLELVEATGLGPEVGDKEKLLEALIDRERIESTAIAEGIAVPHAKIPSMSEFIIAYGRSRTGIAWTQRVESLPVHHVFLIAGPTDRQHRYLQFLAAVTMEIRRGELRNALDAAQDARKLLQVFRDT